jgi:hypothetical protein
VLGWAKAFVLTLAVECWVAGYLLGRLHSAAVCPRLGRRLTTVAFANLASHPAVWFVFPAFLRGTLALSVQETWAVTVEAALYAFVFPSLGARGAIAASALSNGISLGVGLALRAWTGFV